MYLLTSSLFFLRWVHFPTWRKRPSDQPQVSLECFTSSVWLLSENKASLRLSIWMRWWLTEEISVWLPDELRAVSLEMKVVANLPLMLDFLWGITNMKTRVWKSWRVAFSYFKLRWSDGFWLTHWHTACFFVVEGRKAKEDRQKPKKITQNHGNRITQTRDQGKTNPKLATYKACFFQPRFKRILSAR